MSSISRRGLIGKAALLGGSMLLASSEEALAATVALPAAMGEKASKDYLPVFQASARPLPFDSKSLDGFSSQLIESHYDNEYKKAIDTLNALRMSIAKLPPHTPPFLMASLKQQECEAMNTVHLHELYFENLGADGGIGDTTKELLRKSFGSMEAWKQNFQLIGQSLAGKSGWAMLVYSQRDNRAYNVLTADNGIGLQCAIPVLVMDMHEHAYHLDCGADAKTYIANFFENINWKIVEKRIESALS